MQWTDKGIILHTKRHKETGHVVSLFTKEHGRYAGFIRGSQKSLQQKSIFPGNVVTASWQARLSEHLGTYTLETEKSLFTHVLNEPPRLAALTSLCALLYLSTPEREAMPEAFEEFLEFLDLLFLFNWEAAYVRFELFILHALGFGLSLEHCARTGATTDLAYVSPRTGRALSRTVGEDYRHQLLALPPFLQLPNDQKEPIAVQDILTGLELTGYFLERYVLHPHDKKLPYTRVLLIHYLKRRAHEEENKGRKLCQNIS